MCVCVCVCVSGGGAGGRGAPQWRWDLSWALILIRERLETVSWKERIYTGWEVRRVNWVAVCACLVAEGASSVRLSASPSCLTLTDRLIPSLFFGSS